MEEDCTRCSNHGKQHPEPWQLLHGNSCNRPFHSRKGYLSTCGRLLFRYVKVVALPKSTSSLQIIQALGQVCKGVGTPTQHQQPAVSTSEWRSGVSRQDSEKYPEEGAGSNGSTAGI